MTCGDGVGRDGGDGVADAGGGLFEELRRVYLKWYALGEAAGEGGLRGGCFGCADDLKAFVEMYEPELVEPVSGGLACGCPGGPPA